VTARLDPKGFTIRTVPPRLDESGDPMASVLGEGLDVAAALGRLDRAR
jgi:DNA primase